MRVLKKYKDETGVTMGYLISDGKNKRKISHSFAKKLYKNKLLDNVVLVSDDFFRAKPGYHIDVVYEKSSLSVVPVVKRSSLPATEGGHTERYFGENYIDVCRRIRQYANNGNIEVRTNRHGRNEGRNVHLFKLIKSCGISIKQFVVGFLSVLQPYSLEKFQKGVWVCDIGYKTSMLIKMENLDTNKPIVISFHESNVKGRSRSKNVDFTEKLCAVLADEVHQFGDAFKVFYYIQKGFIRFRLSTTTTRYKNGVALVDYIQIRDMWNDSLKARLTTLVELYNSLNNSSANHVLERVSGDKLSFMSYGFATTHNICMLVDLHSAIQDQGIKVSIEGVATELMFEASDNKRKEIQIALQAKYENSNTFVNNLILLK